MSRVDQRCFMAVQTACVGALLLVFSASVTTVRANPAASGSIAGDGGVAGWYQERMRNLGRPDTNIEALKRQAQANDTNAQYQLGLLYQSGRGVQRDLRQAYQWFEKAAKSGNAYAQYALALMFRDSGDERSVQQSLYWQQQAANSGHPEAQYGLGLLYANGQYVPRDPGQAKRWYQQAAQRGHEMAGLALQELRHQPAAPARAVSALTPVNRPAPKVTRPPVQRPAAGAERQPLQPAPVAQNRPAPKPTVNHQQSQADLAGMDVNSIRNAAQGGDPYAQLMLGALYEDGSEGVPKDVKQAFNWYLKAARGGYPKAQHNLALLYEDGRGTQQSYKQAANWYKKAAEAGFSEAQNNLAVLYIMGRGVPEDRRQAEKLLRAAVAQGNPNAKRNLKMLLEGVG